MSTNSIKSQNDEDTHESEGSDELYDQRQPSILSRGVWLAASVAILIEGALVRLYELELNPLHHDEGVNGYFFLRLFREGIYHYDPTNYH